MSPMSRGLDGKVSGGEIVGARMPGKEFGFHLPDEKAHRHLSTFIIRSVMS
jgi:hypothetical protein